MKTLLLTALLATTIFTTQAQAGEILGATQVSGTEVELTILSENHCNNPEVELAYKFSGRAIFGPHFYDLDVLPLNRMLCLSKEKFTAVVAIPEGLGTGDLLVIRGENKSMVELEIR